MKHLFSIVFLIVTLSACQREFDPTIEAPQRGQTSDSVLTKIVFRDGNDSIVTTFTYDKQKGETEVKEDGPDAVAIFKIKRNSAGMVESIVEIVKEHSRTEIDTTFYTMHYNAAGKNIYTIGRSRLIMAMFVYDRVDSTVHKYNAAGKLDEKLIYTKGLWSDTLALSYRHEYTYSGINTVTRKSYRYSNSPNRLYYTQVYTYDDKLNPAPYYTNSIGELMNEVTFLPLIENNITTYSITSHGNPSDNAGINISYIYDSKGRPLKATFNYSGALSGPPVEQVYYYK